MDPKRAGKKKKKPKRKAAPPRELVREAKKYEGPVAGAVLWTGLVTTALVRFGENSALAKVPVGEATVLVGSEPLWAALWAAALFGTIPDAHQCAGGVLILAACVVSARPPREDGA